MRFTNLKVVTAIPLVCILTVTVLNVAWYMSLSKRLPCNTKAVTEPKEAAWFREKQLTEPTDDERSHREEMSNSKQKMSPMMHNTDWSVQHGSKKSFRQEVKPETSDRWIIVDAVDLPLSHIQHVTDVPGWHLLLYGDNVQHLTVKSCSNCIFVDDSFLQQPENKMLLPFQGATPFLHAIYRGAKWIYLTRTVYNLDNEVKGFMLTEKTKGMMYKDDRTFDVESHFGVSENRTVRPAYWLGKWITPSVQVKWEPNPELRKSSLYDITKVERLPHSFVPIRQLPPLNTKGLLVGYESFWSLVGLLTLHEGKPESWRLWRQWLYKDLNSVIGVLPPSGYETRTFFSKDFKEIGWSKKIDVDKFVCGVHRSFFKCAIDLMKGFVSRRLLSETDLKLVEFWFDWLTKQRYQEPSPLDKELKPDILHTVLYEPDSQRFSPHLTDPFGDICNRKPFHEANKVAQLQDVVLVVMFNFPHYYTNIIPLNYIYRKEFTNVVFCGQSIGKYIKFKKGYPPKIIFIEVNEVGNGIYPYMCGAYVMDMGYKVAGYLSIGDDTLLNVWNIVKLPRDKVWFQHSIRNGSLEQKTVPSVVLKEPFWVPWRNTKVGAEALIRTWDYFEALMLSKHYKTEISNFFTTLERNFGRSRGAFYEASDIFYVPNRLSQHFSLFSKLFYKETLYLEIAIPTALLGGEYLENIVRLTGSYVWGDDRPSTVKYYNSNHVFLHAWKLSNIRKKSDEQNMYCERYLPYIDGKK